MLPRPETFIVTGVFQTEMWEYDNSYIYVDLDAARARGRARRRRDRDRGEDGEPAGRRPASPRNSIRCWVSRGGPKTGRMQNASLFKALQLEKLAMAVILLLIVIVAALNIVSTLTMVVRDKTREIGILKAMGLRAGSVRNVFLLQGSVIGLVGTAAGLVIGVAARRRARPLQADPARSEDLFHRSPAGGDAGRRHDRSSSSRVSSSRPLATLYPARQAARLSPVEAIRDE